MTDAAGMDAGVDAEERDPRHMLGDEIGTEVLQFLRTRMMAHTNEDGSGAQFCMNCLLNELASRVVAMAADVQLQDFDAALPGRIAALQPEADAMGLGEPTDMTKLLLRLTEVSDHISKISADARRRVAQARGPELEKVLETAEPGNYTAGEYALEVGSRRGGERLQ